MAYWTNEKIIELIENYKIAECIWNHKHDQHNCRNSVSDAWMAISLSVGEDILEIKRKMKNLVGQFYREHKKYRKLNKSLPGPEIKPKWFAFNHLLFLQTRKKKKVGLNTDTDEGQNEDSLDSLWSNNENDNNFCEIPIEITETKLEIPGVENDHFSDESADHKDKECLNEPTRSSISHKEFPEKCSINSNNLQKRSISRLNSPNITKIIRRKSNEHEKRKTAIIKTYNKSRNRNECDIFGELIACKMKNLHSDIARNNVEHVISNILWEASLGKYDQPPNISSAESPSPGASTPYPNEPTCSSSTTFGSSILNVEHQKNQD